MDFKDFKEHIKDFKGFKDFKERILNALLQALNDFKERILKYEEVYATITDRNYHYIKLIDM